MDPDSVAARSEFAEHLVEPTEKGSAIEAEQLAAQLRRHGFVALANAARLPGESTPVVGRPTPATAFGPGRCG